MFKWATFASNWHFVCQTLSINCSGEIVNWIAIHQHFFLLFLSYSLRFCERFVNDKRCGVCTKKCKRLKTKRKTTREESKTVNDCNERDKFTIKFKMPTDIWGQCQQIGTHTHTRAMNRCRPMKITRSVCDGNMQRMSSYFLNAAHLRKKKNTFHSIKRAQIDLFLLYWYFQRFYCILRAFTTCSWKWAVNFIGR